MLCIDDDRNMNAILPLLCDRLSHCKLLFFVGTKNIIEMKLS